MANRMAHITVGNVCGVYLLEDTVTGATYVGSAKKIRARVTGHFTDMQRRRGLRTYQTFHSTFNTHGATAFRAKILEQCDVSQLLERERAWIAALTPTENSYVRADSRTVYSPDIRSKKSAAVVALWAQPEYRARAVAARKGNQHSVGYRCTPAQIENRQRAARISAMKRKYGADWKQGYLEWYPQHAGDVHG